MRQTSRSGFDIDDYGMIGINQVVIEVAELTPSFFHIPCGGGISRRKISGIARVCGITGIQGLEILAHRPGCRPSISDRVHAFDPPGTPGIATDQTAVHGEAFATNQSCTTALPNNILKQHPVNIAFSEPAIAVLREGGMIRHGSFKTQAAKPAIGQVEMYLAA